MTPHRPTHLLARLELGFRTDSARLQMLEQDLTATMQSARGFGKQSGSSEVWNTSWDQQWDHVEQLQRGIHGYVREMQGALESGEPDRFARALAAWDAFQVEDANLADGLGVIQAQANGMTATFRKNWNQLAHSLDLQFETIHACAQTLRIKLELLRLHSSEEVGDLVRAILAKLPDRAHVDGMDAATVEQEYRTAFTELQQEHHRFLGLLDVVKALLLFVETPAERVWANRSLRVEEA
ncbi:MAG: hypothetical protein EBS05_18960 [Proteobacteria bacterium]|nr:hypothetical protein [Pseudomonadota bacterium]